MVYVNEIIKVLVVLGEDNDGSATKRMVDAKTGILEVCFEVLVKTALDPGVDLVGCKFPTVHLV